MIAVSIVVYNPDIKELSTCLNCVIPSKLISQIEVVDNSSQLYVSEFLNKHFPSVLYTPSNNIGYGAANNISINRSLSNQEIRYHLVLNSDISFDSKIITTLISKLNNDNTIGLIAPSVTDKSGQPQSTCHPLPSPLDLIKHRFIPHRFLKKWRSRYDIIPQNICSDINIPYIHGCFMLFKIEALRDCGLFDPRYFMYPEDIDITRRIHSKYKTIVTPDISIYHLHRAASRHNFKMLYIHAINMVKYFNKWGWFHDKERTAVNRQLTQDLSLLP